MKQSFIDIANESKIEGHSGITSSERKQLLVFLYCTLAIVQQQHRLSESRITVSIFLPNGRKIVRFLSLVDIQPRHTFLQQQIHRSLYTFF